MEIKHLSHNNDFSFSLEGAMSPEIEAPSRFARALKRARFARGWTQIKLAEQLAINKRAIVSWETASRVPGVGMVLLLIDVLSKKGLSIHHELLSAYMLDDLERQLQRKESEDQQEDKLSFRLQQVISQVEQMSIEQPELSYEKIEQGIEVQTPLPGQQRQEAPEISSQPSLEPLFALLEQLHQRPDLIPVAHDFIRELAPGE